VADKVVIESITNRFIGNCIGSITGKLKGVYICSITERLIGVYRLVQAG
jgi:hypothetical protein